MLTSAALCPSTPLLVPELGGRHPALPELRRAVDDAVATMLDAGPDLVAVVGAAPVTATWPVDAAVDFGPFRGEATADGDALPLPLALGATLLRDAGHAGGTRFQGVAPDAPPDACAGLGRELAAAAGTVALLVVGDGSARRSLTAPGWFDGRAAPFDAATERAVRGGDLRALLAVDPDLATALQAGGRPGWQVLAGAADGLSSRSRVGYADAPLGVGYLVAAVRFSA
jgi:hypothetical protein